jgi:hypothetical protein
MSGLPLLKYGRSEVQSEYFLLVYFLKTALLSVSLYHQCIQRQLPCWEVNEVSRFDSRGS